MDTEDHKASDEAKEVFSKVCDALRGAIVMEWRSTALCVTCYLTNGEVYELSLKQIEPPTLQTNDPATEN